jgi:hypothetical protein
MERVEKMIVAVAKVNPRSHEEVNEYFKREGDTLRVKAGAFTDIVARNSGSKRFFYYSREQKVWTLSAAGQFKLSQLAHREDK